MHKKTWAAVAAVGMASAIAIPTIVFGNARPDTAAATNTPFVAHLLGSNEVPNSTPGSETQDPDGFGNAAITFNLTSGSEDMCWDLSYGNLTGTPIAAHIHGPAAPGANGPVVLPFTPFSTLGATSASNCRALTAPEIVIATDLVAHPENYYVNIHTTDFPGGAIRGQLAIGAAPAGQIHMLPSPLRAYDSRDNNGAKIGINEVRTVSLATGRDGSGNVLVAVPPGATAAIVNLTVTETTVGPGGPGGFLTMFSAALNTVPATSSINWSAADQNIAVTAQVSVDASGQIKVRDGSNATHFVVDVIGYLF
jgi:hypothetical protein